MSRLHHRPVLRDPDVIETIREGSDPVRELHAAHETAAVLVTHGRTTSDPAVVERLVTLVDDLGLDTLAELWSRRPARSLPGALWRLYTLREWVAKDADEASREYAAGSPYTEAHHVVAGVDPTGPQEIRRVADQILRGAYTGDFAVALERASAFCQVVAQGRRELFDDPEPQASADRLQQTARDLTACAALWRAGELN